MIQKQMMMICSLFLAAIAIILATDEEQLAQLRLPYHTSILTGEGYGAAHWAPTLDPYRTRSQP